MTHDHTELTDLRTGLRRGLLDPWHPSRRAALYDSIMTDSFPNTPARQFPQTPPAFEPPPPPPMPPGAPEPTLPARPALYDHDPSSRELLLGWCFWLLGSWFVLGLGLDGKPPRWMIFSAMIGMLILWPLYRLSQDGFLPARKRWKWYEPTSQSGDAASTDESTPPGAAPSAEQVSSPATLPTRSTRTRLTPWLILRDWVSMNVVFQAIIWPHLLTKTWTGSQPMWVISVVLAWSLLIAAVIAWGCQSPRGLLRGLAMTLVLGILMFEPVAMGLLNQISEARGAPDVAWQMRISPIEALYAVTQPAEKFYIQPWIGPIISVAVAAVLAWAGLLWQTRSRSGPVAHGQPV